MKHYPNPAASAKPPKAPAIIGFVVPRTRVTPGAPCKGYTQKTMTSNTKMSLFGGGLVLAVAALLFYLGYFQGLLG